MDMRRTVQSAYDELADAYANRPTSDSTPEPLERFLEEYSPEDELLNAGCGGGDPTLEAAGESGVGLDFSREQLARARTTVSAELVQGDMTALPFAAHSFDAVAALYSLIHIPLDDHRTVLSEFARVLRPDGTLLVSEGGVEWSGSNPNWLDSGTEMRWSMAGPERTRTQLRECGFELVGQWDVPDPTTDDGEKPFFLATRL